MTTHLLDASALIALTLRDHEHHERAARWASRADRIALCPIVEGALVRFVVRLGYRVEVASTLLDALHTSPRCEFWADDISYRSANLRHVVGHRQVTDSYLVALTEARGGRLATFDEALARTLPARVELIS